jgi:hypothetical protein
MKTCLIEESEEVDYISKFLKESPFDIIKIIFIDYIYNIENNDTKSFLYLSKEIRNIFFKNKKLLISLLDLNHGYWQCKMVNHNSFYIPHSYYFKSIEDFYKQYFINKYHFFNNNERKKCYNIQFEKYISYLDLNDIHYIYFNINKHLSDYDRETWRFYNDDENVFEYNTCNCLTCIYRIQTYMEYWNIRYNYCEMSLKIFLHHKKIK